VRKLAGIAFLLYCGLAVIFIAAYLLALTAFPLPPGPPILAAVSIALAVAGVTRLTGRQR